MLFVAKAPYGGQSRGLPRGGPDLECHGWKVFVLLVKGRSHAREVRASAVKQDAIRVLRTHVVPKCFVLSIHSG